MSNIRAIAVARATEIDGVFDLYYRHHRLSQVDLREAIVQA